MAFMQRRAEHHGPPSHGRPEDKAAGPAASTPRSTGKVGAARVSPAQVSARAVLKAAAPVAARPLVKGVPVQPMAPRPSLAQTLGDAPLPTDDFTAVVAGADPGGVARQSDSPAEACHLSADADAELPADSGQGDRPATTAAAATTVAADDRQPLPTIHFITSRSAASLDLAECERRGPPISHGAGAGLGGLSQQISPELVHVIQAWPGLPSPIQAAILAMAQAGSGR